MKNVSNAPIRKQIDKTYILRWVVGMYSTEPFFLTKTHKIYR